MTFRILTVCSANVCRSPLVEALLRKSLSDPGAPFVVGSAGESANQGQPACSTFVGDQPDLALDQHRSRSLTLRDVENADLVLAADRPSRTAVVRLQPTAHARAFTLREAAVLATHAVPGELAGYDDPVDALLALVTEMSDRRGTVALPSASRHRVVRRPWRRLEVHGNDVPDAHKVVDSASHALVARLISESTTALAQVLLATARSASGGNEPGQPRYAVG